ncbi:lipoprotein insertase outer membrane protein LolB [Pseudomonas sp. F1_0610]|uniref:lipoprotein insertase outer membrane protein LolB n=1 Tax=Pseudomonas sp. F1_0610 TaxID=3114284 RepID=UPI0039C39DDD
MPSIRLITLCGMIALLTGCSLFSPRSQISEQSQATPAQWKQHADTVEPINSWDILGKIAIRTQQDSGSANLMWKQNKQTFDITLVGPLGQGATRLSGSPGFAQLNIANRGEFYAPNAEALMDEHLGWNLPVERLLWWVRGLPSPASKNQVRLDSEGRLAQLSQDGWNIHYLSYKEESSKNLPQRIKLQGNGIEITLVVKQWQAQVR